MNTKDSWTVREIIAAFAGVAAGVAVMKTTGEGGLSMIVGDASTVALCHALEKKPGRNTRG